MITFHQPVLLKEVLEILKIKKGKKYIDATIGGGGHTSEILKRGGIVLGIDLEREAIRYIRENYQLPITNYQLRVVQGNFKNLGKIAKRYGFDKAAGIIFDLGLSSWQIEKSGRGFSFRRDEPLDMRASLRLKITAADLINTSGEEELYEIFTKFGEEVNSLPIARAIIRARALRPFKTTGQVIEVIEKVCRHLKPKEGVKQRLIQKTKKRIFQALRIAVNKELENLKRGLSESLLLLEKRGRIVVISYHSLEDRIVKNFFLRERKRGRLEILTKRPIRPALEEVKRNPRAKSAKLRAAITL